MKKVKKPKSKNKKRADLMNQDRFQKEKQDKQMSAAITLGVTVALLFAFMFWVGLSGMVPPPDEPQWKTVGRIDFGTDALGALKVNNFQDPSPRPSDKPKSNPKPKKTETKPKSEVSDPAPKQNKSETQSDNTVVESKTETQPKETTTNNPKPKTENATTDETSDPNKSDNKPDSNPKSDGGSNQGDTDKTGNKGNPKSKVLDINGAFQFGDGIGGEGGRAPLKLPLEDYNIQKEGRITFDFIISPSGDVVFVKARSNTQPALAEIGKKNIKKWKFQEVDPGRGRLKTSVTITFRLR